MDITHSSLPQPFYEGELVASACSDALCMLAKRLTIGYLAVN
ncbi:MAG: hypothetical protein Q8M40_08485 [Legionella sp.]|nr:hypothetical protein [Legionella sp.]